MEVSIDKRKADKGVVSHQEGSPSDNTEASNTPYRCDPAGQRLFVHFADAWFGGSENWQFIGSEPPPEATDRNTFQFTACFDGPGRLHGRLHDDPGINAAMWMGILADFLPEMKESLLDVLLSEGRLRY